ncbi:hypothetical protein TVAGG3_0154950, partial [Trichomonas vaginalis G3]
YPDTNFQMNDDLPPMKEPNLNDYILEANQAEEKPTNKNKAGIIAGSIVGALALIAIIVAVVFIVRAKRAEKSASDKEVTV